MALEFEKIQPWDGQSGTGSEARGVIDRNFEKINPELEKKLETDDLTDYAKTGGSEKTVKEVETEIAQLAGATDEKIAQIVGVHYNGIDSSYLEDTDLITDTGRISASFIIEPADVASIRTIGYFGNVFISIEKNHNYIYTKLGDTYIYDLIPKPQYYKIYNIEISWNNGSAILAVNGVRREVNYTGTVSGSGIKLGKYNDALPPFKGVLIDYEAKSGSAYYKGNGYGGVNVLISKLRALIEMFNSCDFRFKNTDNITWADGSIGSISLKYNEIALAYDGFTATHDVSGFIITQPDVIRDANYELINKPEIVITTKN